MPDAPRSLDVVETSRSHILLEWQPPRSDGGAPIRGYIVNRRQSYSTRFVRASRGLVYDTSYRDNNVYEGCDYEYQVTAENEAGEGVPSNVVGPVKAKEPFGEFCMECGWLVELWKSASALNSSILKDVYQDKTHRNPIYFRHQCQSIFPPECLCMYQ